MPYILVYQNKGKQPKCSQMLHFRVWVRAEEKNRTHLGISACILKDKYFRICQHITNVIWMFSLPEGGQKGVLLLMNCV